jgi:hypothetical protein
MTRIFAALILSTAALGAAQAGETGYLDNPGARTQSALSRAQVQDALNADRAQADAFQGQLDPRVSATRVGTFSREQAARQVSVAGPAVAAFVNG